ncbi:Crp/Fnr family transcriptional regulator [Salibacterium aidingense]|uniref:Crp/Fnr family transcriptional regulator n=1 Tax=Salibacterium aidingense TaxID=384933 RepID=UPI00041953CE|nr:Crp/Fnr family transcriptional regulator [Salibacterium aidingense]
MRTSAVNRSDINHYQNTAGYSAYNLDAIKDIMYMHPIERGHFLFLEDDPADKLFFIREGKVKLTKTTTDGKEHILSLFGKGDMFGELSSFQELAHSYSAYTLEDSQIGIIQQKDMEILLWQHGDLAIEFMHWNTLMERITKSKLRDLTFHGKSGALASTLIRLCNSYGAPDGNSIFIQKRIKNGELGDFIGATRESVNRLLSDMKKQEIISQRDGCLVIHEISALKAMCYCEECPVEICRM